MSSFSILHHELRLRVPNKPSEFYDDAIRWAINHICVKTSLWKIVTSVTTESDENSIDIDLDTDTAIHSTLFIVQKGNIDRTVKRPVNGNVGHYNSNSDYLKSFITLTSESVQIIPTPKDGGVELEIHTSVKPTRSATDVNNEKFFNEYEDTVVYGALYRLYELEGDIAQAEYNNQKFKNGVSSIHVDVLKENANTPMKMSAAW